MGLDHHSQ
jgi:hypothetical protein